MTEQATASLTNSGQTPEQQHQQLLCNQETLPYKNRLQEFTQRAKIPLPVYQTVNERQCHAPKFKSTVVVDGITYTSVNAFSSRRAAEQDVAKVALEGISRKINNWVSNKMNEEGFPPIYEEKVVCKSILHEFAAKMNLDKPKYNTVRFEGLLPGFVSSVVFGGVTYTGEACKSKKEAEQCAAREVILSIVGNLGLATILPEIIKAKAKFFSIAYKQSSSEVSTGVPSVGLDSGNSIGASATTEAACRDKDANKAGTLVGSTVPEAPEQQVSDVHSLGDSVSREVAFGDKDANKAGNPIADTPPEAHEGMAPDAHSLGASAPIKEAGNKDAKKAGSLIVNAAPEAPELQVSDVHSLQAQPNFDILNRSKKRKSKRKKEADKKLKTEEPNLNTAEAVSKGAQQS